MNTINESNRTKRLPLAQLEVFVAIVRTGHMREAGRLLGVQPSTISHQLKSLENFIGEPLIARTTRKLDLTSAGRRLAKFALPSFEQLTQVVAELRQPDAPHKQNLRITLPDFAYQYCIQDKLKAFRENYPNIEVELSLNEGFVDLHQSGFHAGMRLGDRVNQDMIAVSVGKPLEVGLFASAEYIKHRGLPVNPEDLLKHECIHYRFIHSQEIAPWVLSRDGQDFTVNVKGSLTVNSLSLLIDHISQGLGISYTFQFLVSEQLAQKEFVNVLPEHNKLYPSIHFYYPTQYRGNTALKNFVEFIR